MRAKPFHWRSTKPDVTARHITLIGPVPPPWGGVQTHIMELRQRIQSHGDRCSILNLTRHRQPDHDDLYFPNSAGEVISTLGRLNPDIVHVHFGGNLFPRQAALFLVLAARRRTRNIFTFHSGGYPTSEQGLRATPMSLHGFALRRLDAVVGVNAALVETFRRYGVKERKLHLIEPYAAGLDRAAVVREALPDAIESFVARHNPFLLAVGLLEPEYGLDVQLAAFGKIRQQHPNAGLVLIGSGSLHDSLRATIDAHPERDHILLAGDVPRPKTLAAIARANLLLRTTHYDGDALSVREALSMGTRVLATDNGMRPGGVQLLPRLDAETLIDAVSPALASTPPGGSAPAHQGPDPMGQILILYDELTRKT